MSYYGGPQQQQPGYQPQGGNPYVSGRGGQPGWNVPPQGVPVYGTGATQYMEEGGMPKSNLGFDDSTIRANFVRKVFFLVAIMLVVVTLMCGIPFLHPPLMTFVQQNYGLYLMGYITFIIVYIALICSDSLRRSYPANIICLGLLTLSIGFMTMMITAYHTFDSVFICFLITAISCGAISLFSMTTKKDLTSLMGIMFIATLCLALFGLIIMFISIFNGNVRTLHVVYATIGAFLFMIWLAIDIQMIMGGRTYEISPEEHILASILLFLDIIQIFWFLLMIFGERDR